MGGFRAFLQKYYKCWLVLRGSVFEYQSSVWKSQMNTTHLMIMIILTYLKKVHFSHKFEK